MRTDREFLQDLQTYQAKEYQVWLDMFDALNSGTDIQAVIINDDSLQMLYEENEDLKDSIKIIGTIKLTKSCTATEIINEC